MTTVMVGVDTDTQLIVPKLYEITGKQMGVLADAFLVSLSHPRQAPGRRRAW